jgi:hypothetical protein
MRESRAAGLLQRVRPRRLKPGQMRSESQIAAREPALITPVSTR